MQDREAHASRKHFSVWIKTADFICNPLGDFLAYVTNAYVGTSQRRPGQQGAWAVTSSLLIPRAALLSQAACKVRERGESGGSR